jgi:hypothetical protein
MFLMNLVLSLEARSQSLVEFNSERNQIDKHLMISLGSWATSNFVLSGIGWASVPKSEAYYFHQMNVLWNTVNIALAIPGYFKAKNDNRTLTLNETKKIQRKTQNIFLLNTGLDVVYISSGFLLRNSAQLNLSERERFKGFGNALILQGGFLFIFDLTAYAIHKCHANKFLNKLEMSSNGLGFTWKIGNEPNYKNHCFL